MADTVASLTTLLANVDAAIVAAETAQTASSDGTSLSRANLATLYARRDVLANRLAMATAAASGRSWRFSRGRVKNMGGI